MCFQQRTNDFETSDVDVKFYVSLRHEENFGGVTYR